MLMLTKLPRHACEACERSLAMQRRVRHGHHSAEQENDDAAYEFL